VFFSYIIPLWIAAFFAYNAKNVRLSPIIIQENEKGNGGIPACEKEKSIVQWKDKKNAFALFSCGERLEENDVFGGTGGECDAGGIED
jgi:hypothetical protein